MGRGIDRRSFLKTAAVGVGAGIALAKGARGAESGVPSANSKSVFGLRVPPMEVVRIGMIGVGGRGGAHLGTYLRLEGCEIRAICDNYEPHAKRAQNRVVKAGQPKPEIYTNGDYDYRRMLERDDLDLVVINTFIHQIGGNAHGVCRCIRKFE